MIRTLLKAIESPAEKMSIIEIGAIKKN